MNETTIFTSKRTVKLTTEKKTATLPATIALKYENSKEIK